jgi:hypothetical protein
MERICYLLAWTGIRSWNKWVHLGRCEDGTYEVDFGFYNPSDPVHHDIATFTSLFEAMEYFRVVIRRLLREARQVLKNNNLDAGYRHLLEQDVAEMQQILNCLRRRSLKCLERLRAARLV